MEISEIRTAAPTEGRSAVELETFSLLDRLHIPYAWVGPRDRRHHRRL